MARAEIKSLHQTNAPGQYDRQNEDRFRKELVDWARQIQSAIATDPLGPSGVPFSYDPITDTMLLDSNVDVTGDLTLDAKDDKATASGSTAAASVKICVAAPAYVGDDLAAQGRHAVPCQPEQFAEPGA